MAVHPAGLEPANLLVRSQALYPIELRVQYRFSQTSNKLLLGKERVLLFYIGVIALFFSRFDRMAICTTNETLFNFCFDYC